MLGRGPLAPDAAAEPLRPVAYQGTMRIMANPNSFHAFTDSGGVYGGAVLKLVTKGRAVTFDYEYLYAGVVVTGKFEGEHEADGSLDGTWIERAAAPINGAQNWNGTASFAATDTDRLYLRGTWAMAGSPTVERWLVDAAKK